MSEAPVSASLTNYELLARQDVLQANGIAPPLPSSKNPAAHEPVATSSTTKQELGKRRRTWTRDQNESEDNEGLAAIERVEKKLLVRLNIPSS